MHQHINDVNLIPLFLQTFIRWLTSRVFTNVTIGIGEDIHILNASERLLFWGSISLFMFFTLSVSSHRTGNLATGYPCPDTTPCYRNSVYICIRGEQATTPYGTSRNAPGRLSCLPRNASSATSRYEWGRAAFLLALLHLYKYRQWHKLRYSGCKHRSSFPSM